MFFHSLDVKRIDQIFDEHRFLKNWFCAKHIWQHLNSLLKRRVKWEYPDIYAHSMCKERKAILHSNKFFC